MVPDEGFSLKTLADNCNWLQGQEALFTYSISEFHLSCKRLQIELKKDKIMKKTQSSLVEILLEDMPERFENL